VEVQLAAVREDGLAIKYISHPCVEVQLAAVRENSSAFFRIVNPHPKTEKLFEVLYQL